MSGSHRGGRSGAALEAGGNLDTIAGDTTSLDEKTPTLGVTTSANASPSVLASDDAQLGSVGAGADVDGNIHGQLRYIGESVDALPTSLGQATAAASVPVIQASDTPFGRINAKGNVPVVITIADANSTQSAALPVGNYIATSNIDVAIIVAANPTATAAYDKLWAYSYRRVVIGTANDKVAAIRLVASTGTVTLTLEG